MTHMASARALDTHIAQKREFGANPTVLQSPQGEAAQAWTMHHSVAESKWPSAKNGLRRDRAPLSCPQGSDHLGAYPKQLATHEGAANTSQVRGRPITEAARPAPGQHRKAARTMAKSHYLSYFHRLRQALQDREHLVQDQVTPGTTQEAQLRQHRWKPSLPHRNPSIPGEGCLTVLGCGLAAVLDDDSADDDDDPSSLQWLKRARRLFDSTTGYPGEVPTNITAYFQKPAQKPNSVHPTHQPPLALSSAHGLSSATLSTTQPSTDDQATPAPPPTTSATCAVSSTRGSNSLPFKNVDAGCGNAHTVREPGVDLAPKQPEPNNVVHVEHPQKAHTV